jgi:hypothetical protein
MYKLFLVSDTIHSNAINTTDLTALGKHVVRKTISYQNSWASGKDIKVEFRCAVLSSKGIFARISNETHFLSNPETSAIYVHLLYNKA